MLLILLLFVSRLGHSKKREIKLNKTNNERKNEVITHTNAHADAFKSHTQNIFRLVPLRLLLLLLLLKSTEVLLSLFTFIFSAVVFFSSSSHCSVLLLRSFVRSVDRGSRRRVGACVCAFRKSFERMRHRVYVTERQQPTCSNCVVPVNGRVFENTREQAENMNGVKRVGCRHTAHAYKCHNTGDGVGVCSHRGCIARWIYRFGLRRRQNTIFFSRIKYYGFGQKYWNAPDELLNDFSCIHTVNERSESI